ncbi:unnamed protein product [Polarella glacialis]|uniref:Uncharacterized protein n=1 Tax=Polarella glacialis TaxID=89957 RepID=A0A813E4L2_POLGL|nr:unnamed protein product [Polarella glacialis]
MLGAAGIMGDAWLQGMASHHPEANVSFIGTFPGIVATGLVETSKTFPEWLRPFLGNAEKLIAISPEKSGVLHTTILSSPNPAQRPVTYFNSNLEGRLTNGLAYDADFVQWLWSFLEDTEARHGAAAELGDMTHNALVV